jgi:hypothetical protein
MYKPPYGVRLEHGHPLARGLAGAWLFNEGRGSTAWDLGGARHTGTLTGMDPASDWVAGPCGYGLDFDGLDDRVIVGPEGGINLGTANACIVRYKHKALGNDVLVGHKSQSDGGYFLAFGSGNVYYCADNSYVGVAHGIVAGDEVWLGVSRQGTSVTFYKNGVPLGTVQTLGANNDLRISTIGSYWSGSSTYSTNMRCDYVYCWRRSLSPGQIAWLFRDPFCFLRRPGAMLLAAFPGGTIHNVSGMVSAASVASGSATVIPAAWQPTGTPWPKATLSIEASWRKEAVLYGMTDTGVRLGTVLTQGWFWARRAGCSAVYRVEVGGSEAGPSYVDPAGSPPVAVAPADAKQIALPTYLSHGPGSNYHYLLRRFDRCGRQDLTMRATVHVRIDPDGQLARRAPNTIFNLKARRTADNKVECMWFYWPLDQAAAPHVFNVYWDDGTGHLDLVNPIAVLFYEGRKYYHYESGPLADGSYLFAVRAESLTGVESPPQAAAACEIRAVIPSEPEIFGAEVV